MENSGMRAQENKIVDHAEFLLALAAFLTTLLLQSGELGSIDTTIRLQTTHSYWTSKPSVPDKSLLRFGNAVAVGRNGRMYAAYGMGQSLLMLPSDIAGTLLAHALSFPPGLRSIVVSYSTNILVCVLTVLVCFRWLCLLEFTPSQAVAGALALLFATTFLHYTQNMMENNLIFLLTLTGLCFQYEWLHNGRTRPLVIGSLALGANLLIRLTTAMDITAAGLFVLLVLLWEEGMRGREVLTRLGQYVGAACPCYAAFFLIDRAYQYWRFGSIFSTYLSVLSEQQKRSYPSLPPDHPWSTPLREGLLGPLISPEKSIFLFDPLTLLTVLLCLLIWKRLHPGIKALLVTGFSLLATYILFYAKYYDWSGDYAWGDRYITTPVQLLAMISIPLLLRHRDYVGKTVWSFGLAIACLSVVIQLASVVFWYPLEIDQTHPVETLGHPTFVVGLRFENIAAVALGKVNQWGLSNQATREKDGIYTDTPYFLPFLREKDGSVSKKTATGLIAGWSTGIAALIVVLWLIQHKARRGDFAGEPGCEGDRRYE
jgi:hypothetical protein